MRIAKALALAGIDSRRNCESYIQQGLVAVNGEVVGDLGRQVNPEHDQISFRGKVLSFEPYVYFLLFKPEGYTTTARDPHAKKTVYELLPRQLARENPQSGRSRTRVFPVGRLDKESSGLLLFTNDGDLAHQLTHPRYQVPKWYHIRLNRPLSPETHRKLLEGVRLSDGWAKAEKLERLSPRVCRLMIQEGRKREIRRLFEALEFQVVRLCRVALGPLQIGSLMPREGRFLSFSEVRKLRNSIAREKPTHKIPPKIPPTRSLSPGPLSP